MFAIGLAGCVVFGDDDSHEPGVDQSCVDARYGDGVCNLDLACSVPDIDCFRTFATDAEAATWWMTEQTKIGQSFPIVPESDPRFGKVRDALDQGWAAFKVHRPVGTLAAKRPALVLVDKPMIQNAAFVYGDTDQPFAVMVETPALVGNVTTEELLGVMMHELQHAVGLHKLGMNGDKLRAFYVAPTGSEPLGRNQNDDANLHMLGTAWREAAAQVGSYSQSELGGFPFAGVFYQMMSTVAGQAVQAHPDVCTAPVQALNDAQGAATANEDPLDSSLTVDLQTVAPQIESALGSLKADCLPSFPYDLIQVGASMAMVTPEQYEAMLEPRDVALVKGKHFVDGLIAIVEDRRATMRDAEAMFQSATGEPWSQLRFFSYEEDADDVSTIVMRAAHKDPNAMSKFFLTVLPPAVASACSAKVASGLPGYGVDLTDEHHALCWRVGHEQRAATEARTLAPQIGAVAIRIPGRFPMPPDPRTRIAD